MSSSHSAAKESNVGKVTGLRSGNRHQAVLLPREILKAAALRAGDRLVVALLPDGTITIGREDSVEYAANDEVIRHAKDVLVEHAELLDRLAK